MKTILLALLAVSTALHAETDVRAAVTQGLGFLARDGEKWMEEKNCNSCHHLPEMLWSHREARRRGLTIDEKKFAEWSEWAAEREKDTKPGAEQIAFSMLAMPESDHRATIELVKTARQKDGTWKPAGQFATMQKRATPEAQLNSTRLFLLALGTSEPKTPAALDKPAAETSIETLVFKALFEKKSGNAAATIETIVKAQHADGGWSWMLAEPQSDALATGQVLYLLATDGAQHTEAIARAVKWLLDRQQADGSWLTDVTRISKIDRSKPEKEKSLKAATEIYHYWGSSWAVLGLLHTLPGK